MKATRWMPPALLGLLAAGALLAHGPGLAGPESVPVAPPPFREMAEMQSAGGRLDVTLRLAYADHRIGADPVRLRSYNGGLAGPTLRVKPGDTLSVRLENRLPCPKPPCRCERTLVDDDHHHLKMIPGPQGPTPPPTVFNTTNLHTHGLHVSPKGDSDNVLRVIEPGCDFQFRFQIPRDHPAGTFWYHPHVHGATAMQVASGAAGALIVEGGLDELPEIKAAEEKVFLFQQIPYDRTGKVEDFDQSFGPGKWEGMKRYTTINGEVQPLILMQAGAVQRWRMIHGGVRETLKIGVAAAPKTPTLPGWLHEFAKDGLATGDLESLETVDLQPGYRSDVMVQAPQRAGTYYLLDEQSPAEDSLQALTEPRKILAVLVVLPQRKPMALPKREQLAFFKPYLSIEDREVAGRPIQKVDFDLHGNQFTINGKEFPGDLRVLELGKADEWLLSSRLANHPFHIHVNPFEVIEKGADGRERRYWRDTILVKPNRPPVRIRSRYEDFDGQFVLHCHILDHEDRGMMQRVEIRK